MFYYAQLDENNLCVAISEYNVEIINEKLIRISSYDLDYLWRKYINDDWTDEKFKPEPEPESPSEIDLLKAKIQSLEEYSEEHEAALVELTELIISLLGGDE